MINTKCSVESLKIPGRAIARCSSSTHFIAQSSFWSHQLQEAAQNLCKVGIKMKYCSTGHKKALTLLYEASIVASPWPAVASGVSDLSLTSEDSNAHLLPRFDLSPPFSLPGSPASLSSLPQEKHDCKEVTCLMDLAVLKKSACLCIQLQNSAISHRNF